MWGLTTVVTAFALALIAMSFAFAGGAVIVAVPLAIIAIAISAAVDFNRRRKHARSMNEHLDEARTEKTRFTARDKRTLTNE
jgi:choline-glycine betaine transporter